MKVDTVYTWTISKILLESENMFADTTAINERREHFM